VISRVGFHPDAKREMREAADFYDSVRGGGIFVSAIAHHSRRPFYWQSRL